MIAAFASLAIMALGCLASTMHVMTDPATLPLDQRALFEAEPGWVFADLGFGFAAGLFGALLLVLRRVAAERVLFISLTSDVGVARRDVREHPPLATCSRPIRLQR